jgi:hypothetical protein
MADNSFQMTITGIADIQNALFQLKPNLAEKVAKVALRQGANFMAKKIRAATPVSKNGSREKNGKGRGDYVQFAPGRLKRAIKVRQSRINTIDTGKIGLYITVAQGKKRNDPRSAWYGKFVEDGYTIGSRTVSAKQAMQMGLVTRDQLNQRRQQSQQNQRNGRIKKTGRMQQRIRYRGAGTRQITGRHFVKNSFEAYNQATAKVISEAAETAFAQLAVKLGLAITNG